MHRRLQALLPLLPPGVAHEFHPFGDLVLSGPKAVVHINVNDDQLTAGTVAGPWSISGKRDDAEWFLAEVIPHLI